MIRFSLPPPPPPPPYAFLLEEEEEGAVFKDTSVHVARATEAVRSPEFWSVIALVRVFADWLAALMYWALGCPCHSRAFREYFELRLDEMDCPLRTCRAPDIAAGDMDRFNIRLSEIAQVAVLAIQARRDLAPPMRASILDEFGIGREFIFAEYTMRIQAGWQCIPLKAMILGHQSMHIVIEGLIHCLAQSESIPPEQYPECCEITLQLFARGSTLREQIICLIRRTHDFSQLPGLQRIRDGAQHAPCVEMSVERRHAAIRAGTRATPNRTVQYDSVHGLRKGELMDIFDDTPAAVERMGNVFDADARSPSQCLQSLGLIAHPSIQSYVKDSGEGLADIPHHVAAEVVYRADFTSQSIHYPEFQRPPPPQFPGHGGGDADGVSIYISCKTFRVKATSLGDRNSSEED